MLAWILAAIAIVNYLIIWQKERYIMLLNKQIHLLNELNEKRTKIIQDLYHSNATFNAQQELSKGNPKKGQGGNKSW